MTMIVDFIQNVMQVFANNKDALDSLKTAGELVGMAGTAAVSLYARGKQLTAFLGTRTETEKKGLGRRVATANTKQLKKQHIAIVVAITKHALGDVAAYLEKKDIDADLLVLTNTTEYGRAIKPLSPKRKEWEEVVREFSIITEKIKKEAPDKAQLHIFISAPVALAYALGAVWGTVDEGALIYHWESQTYVPVVKVTRALKMPEGKSRSA